MVTGWDPSFRPATNPAGAVEPPNAEALDRERRARIGRKARDFLVHIDTLSRLLAIHDPGNAAVQSALRDLVKDVEELQAGGEDLSLVFAEGHAFVNGVWVRASRRAWDAAVLLTDKQMFIQSAYCQGCQPAHDLVDGTGVHVIDMGPVWRSLQEDMAGNFIQGDDHFSVAGNRTVGESLAQALSSWPELRARVERIVQQ